MKTRFQLEMDLLNAGRTYSLLAEQTTAIERQSPPPHSDLWHELRMIDEHRRTALWAYNRIFAQLQAENFDMEPERREA